MMKHNVYLFTVLVLFICAAIFFSPAFVYADVRKFVHAHEGKVTVEEAVAYYLVGSMYRDTFPAELESQIKKALKYTMLKSKSPTTGRLPGQAKSGRQREHEILRARQKALKGIKE